MADRVEQVRFAEAGVTVDKERVVIFRRLLRHVAAGGAGEFIRAALDERLEGVLVFVVLLDGLLLLFLHRRDQLVGDGRAEHALNRVVEIFVKAALNRRFVKFIRRLNDGDALLKVQRNRYELAEPGFVAHLGDLISAVIADQVPCFKKRFHFLFSLSHVFSVAQYTAAEAARFRPEKPEKGGTSAF